MSQTFISGSPIHEGWLRKSPPLESQTVLFRPRWRKRWMVLVQGHHENLYSLHYYTDESKSKLKGSIDLRHCMSISSNSVAEADKKSKQIFTFSLSTPDRVYQFSSDNKQLVQTWIEILTNACRQNPHFHSPHTDKSPNWKKNSLASSSSTKSSTLSLLTPSKASPEVTPVNSSLKKSLKDPYIHLTECYSGNKAPRAPPRPAKSSLDLRKKFLYMEISDRKGDIQYLDLHFPSAAASQIKDLEEDSDNNNDNVTSVRDKEDEVIYRNIDFVKTKAFNETRRQVENTRYNLK